MAACGLYQSDDCVRVVRNTRTVQVPCTRNKCSQYTVRIPRQVSQQVPRTVQYTDYEPRQKQLPYTVTRQERRTRMETQKYTVPVTTTRTRMVPVTKKVPKTVYVNVTTQVPQTYNTTTMQTRERQVPVPYYVNVPETKYRTVTEQVPVQRTKIQYDTVTKTVYEPQIRTRCVPETKIVTRQIPVYNVVPKPAPTCNGANGATNYSYADRDLNYDDVAFEATDMNINSQLYPIEYYDAGQTGNLATTDIVQRVSSDDAYHNYGQNGIDQLEPCATCETAQPDLYI